RIGARDHGPDDGRPGGRQRHPDRRERSAGRGPRRSGAARQGRGSGRGGHGPARNPGEVRMTDHPSIAGIPLVLGGNVFGWTADEDTSFAVLDRFYEAGGRMVDTAQGYSVWAPGHVGGESEAVIGRWMKARGNRAEM